MVNSDSKKPWSNIISIEDSMVVAQPGIALLVNSFIKSTTSMAIIDSAIIIVENIINLPAIISMKTPTAPNPCNKRLAKFIFDFPA